MAETRAVYWNKFKRAAIETGMAREWPGSMVDLLQPVKIPVRWKERVGRGAWRECRAEAEYLPGQVLHRKERRASPWEIEEWKTLSPEALEAIGVFERSGEYRILIVEKIKDLRAAVRQLCRHMVAEEISRANEQFRLLGEAELLESYAHRLIVLVPELLQKRDPNEEGFREIEQLVLDLESIGLKIGRHDLLETQHCQEQLKPWQQLVLASEIITTLFKERARAFEIIVSSLKLGGKRFQLMADIEQRFYNAYYRLGKLGEELQKKMLENKEVSFVFLVSIVREAYGAWLYVGKIPNFDPYYSRLQSPEWQRLGKILQRLKKGGARAAYNDISRAVAKLEAIVIGERVTQAEILRQRRRFSTGPSEK